MLFLIFVLVVVWGVVGIFGIRAVKRGKERKNDRLRDEFTNAHKSAYTDEIRRANGASAETPAAGHPEHDAMQNGTNMGFLASWLDQFNNFH